MSSLAGNLPPVSSSCELARPKPDRGIDLIVCGDRGTEFFAGPIQMKACSRAGLLIDERYGVIPGLLVVYVWSFADPPKAEYYAMTYCET